MLDSLPCSNHLVSKMRNGTLVAILNLPLRHSIKDRLKGLPFFLIILRKPCHSQGDGLLLSKLQRLSWLPIKQGCVRLPSCPSRRCDIAVSIVHCDWHLPKLLLHPTIKFSLRNRKLSFVLRRKPKDFLIDDINLRLRDHMILRLFEDLFIQIPKLPRHSFLR